MFFQVVSQKYWLLLPKENICALGESNLTSVPKSALDLFPCLQG